MNDFDPSRAWLRGPDYFQRFVDQGAAVVIEDAGLNPDLELIIAARSGERAAFVMRELAYPHGVQGELAGEPYLVSF